MASAERTAPDSGERVDVTVLMPCLNEERTIQACVATAQRALRDLAIPGEVLVCDNGSTDQSVSVAESAGARVVRCAIRGYGAALRHGIEAAIGRWVVMADADGSYDFSELPRFVRALRSGARFVMGTRLRGTIVPGAMPNLHRYVGTPVLTAALNLLFGTAISDCNCGMRGFDRGLFLKLGVTSPGMEFASEMIAKAALGGVPIVEVPITLRKDGRERPPHLRPWRDGWRHLRLIVRLAARRLIPAPTQGVR